MKLEVKDNFLVITCEDHEEGLQLGKLKNDLKGKDFEWSMGIWSLSSRVYCIKIPLTE